MNLNHLSSANFASHLCVYRIAHDNGFIRAWNAIANPVSGCPVLNLKLSETCEAMGQKYETFKMVIKKGDRPANT